MIKKIIRNAIKVFKSKPGKTALRKTRYIVNYVIAVYTPIFIIWTFLFSVLNKWALLILLPIFASTHPFHKWLIKKLNEETNLSSDGGE